MTVERPSTLRENSICEFFATAFLLIAVVGSGIAAERLSGGNVGLALLANSLATAAGLFVLILVFGPMSGAHMNPAVTLVAVLVGKLDRLTALSYIAAQICGAMLGVWVTHLMFDLPILQASSHVRSGAGQWAAEAVATAGLIGVIWGSTRHGLVTVAGAVGAYIGGAYWFTASTSFANPAVTIARAFTDTFAGIRPSDTVGFIVAQLFGAALVLPFVRHLMRRAN